MNLLAAQRFPVDQKALRFRSAQPTDYDQLIAESTLVYDSAGRLLIVFEVLPELPTDLLRAFRPVSIAPGNQSDSRIEGLRQSKPSLRSGSHGARIEGLKYKDKKKRDGNGYRTSGLKRQGGGATILGYMPRIALRQDFCSLAAMARNYPKAHATFVGYARASSEIFAQHLPAEYAKQKALVEAKVRPEWRIAGSVYTSGIVNSDNPLAYHTDAGNFPDTWNAMYAIAHDCSGGQLSLPEYRLGFSFAKPAFILFEAQKVLHGVTPLRKRSNLAYRYSVVYYALKGLCHCLAMADEVARIQKVRTTRELKRGGLLARTDEELRMIVGRAARAKAAKGPKP